MSEVYLNLLKACSTITFLLLIDFMTELVLIRKIKDKKQSIKWRVSVRYVLFFCFLFFMAKIWVDGFGFLLTVVGVISAAFTITQKEYLMNLIGWLIIMWRDLFVEGDYIEVGKYSGYVKDIGPLYFSIEEASDLMWGDKTGKVIKIPNSLIAANPIVNFSAEHIYVEGKIVFTFSFKSSLEAIHAVISKLEAQITTTTKPQFLLRVFQEKPLGIQLTIRYVSLKHEQKSIEDKAFEVVMGAVKANEDLDMSVAT